MEDENEPKQNPKGNPPPKPKAPAKAPVDPKQTEEENAEGRLDPNDPQSPHRKQP